MIEEFEESVQINQLEFNMASLSQLKSNSFVSDNWPVVYILQSTNSKEIYIGESINIHDRLGNHMSNKTKKNLDSLTMIYSKNFNKSATLDIESSLIKYISGDGHHDVLNSNAGIAEHSYYQRNVYSDLFLSIWERLRSEKIVKNNISTIENKNLFKYSPYKSLSEDQHEAVLNLLRYLASDNIKTTFVHGTAGTGKSVVATYLMKLLMSDFELDTISTQSKTQEIIFAERVQSKFSDLKVGIVLPMSSFRTTLQRVFNNVKDLDSKMVLAPVDVSRSKFDILLVDEAHRLRQRKNLGYHKSFDEANVRLGLEKENNQLDWVIRQSEKLVLFYDQDQTIRPTDVPQEEFESLANKKNTAHLHLTSQLRVQGSLDYVQFIDDLLKNNLQVGKDWFKSQNYDFFIFDSFETLVERIKFLNKEVELCRLVAGFSWEWKTKKKNGDEEYDIEIEGLRFKWNSNASDWVNSDGARNMEEIGSIHKTQAYDLNYTGLIFGEEIVYDKAKGRIDVIEDNYHDKYGKRGINKSEVRKYIINVYKTLLLRGIKGTYIYVCNKDLREHFKKFIPTYDSIQ